MKRVSPQQAATDATNKADRLIAVGVRAVKSLTVTARAAAIRAFRVGRDPVKAITYIIENYLPPILVDGMVAGHITGHGIAQSRAIAADVGRRKTLSVYNDAIRFLQKRNSLSPSDVAGLRALYGDSALMAVSGVVDSVQKSLGDVVQRMVAQGVTTKEGTARIRKAMDSAGVFTDQPWLAETVFRTNLQMAMGAGQWNANQDPAIQEILWGYEYVTVGDDRVRDNHAALDGFKAPKDEPIWSSIWPPNGYNCRCAVIEVFDDEDGQGVVIPPAMSQPGDDAIPGPDDGWGFNPGELFRAMG